MFFNRVDVTASPIAKRCRRRYHGDETAVAVTTRSSLGRMIVRDPNVVGFVRGLLPPPPPLPALLPRWSLPRQSGSSACLVSAGGGGRITLYMYFFRSVFVVFFNPSTAPSPHDRGRQSPNVATPSSSRCTVFTRSPPRQSLNSLRHNHNNNNILLMLCSSFVRSYPHPSPKTVMITTMIVLMIILLSYTIYDIYNNNILTLTIIKNIVSRRRLRKIANTLKYSIHQLSLYTIVILL